MDIQAAQEALVSIMNRLDAFGSGKSAAMTNGKKKRFKYIWPVGVHYLVERFRHAHQKLKQGGRLIRDYH